MITRRIQLQRRRDVLREARVDELLRIIAAFAASKRGIPGHVLRELVQLQPHWGRRQIPPAVVAARKVLA